MQDEIAKSAYEYQRQIESGEKIIVGVNKFQSEKSNTTYGFKINDSIRQTQIDQLTKLKARRNNTKVQDCLSQINQAARGNSNLMPFVLDAVENYCTLGEISDELRKVFGEYK
jgi:methylmalonyl-CoA mutase N-terminal domain/subunit